MQAEAVAVLGSGVPTILSCPTVLEGLLSPLNLSGLPPMSPGFLSASPSRYSRSISRNGGRRWCSSEGIIHSPAPAPQVRTPVGDSGARGGVGETGHCRKGARESGRGQVKRGQGLAPLAPPQPTPPARPCLYLHRIQAHRLPLLQGSASSLEKKEQSHWLSKPSVISPYAWDLQRQ